jgi:predicted transcriptional regulator
VTTLKVGIASYEEMKARSTAIARGEHKPRRGEPKVWFTSLESFARVLSARNRALLSLIAEAKPDSISELASLCGRAKSNLSRTLRTMENYGLVRLKRGARGKLAPRVAYTEIVLDVPIGAVKPTAREAAQG